MEVAASWFQTNTAPGLSGSVELPPQAHTGCPFRTAKGGMGGRGNGCCKPGVSMASQDLPARQETGLPAMPGLVPVLQLTGSQPVVARPGTWFLSFTCLVCSARAAWDRAASHPGSKHVCSHQPGDMVVMAAGDGGGGGGQAAPLLTKPLSGGAMPLVPERDLVSQSVWQALMGCSACAAAVGNTLTRAT